MWGEAGSRRQIILNNCVVSVTENLALALEAVHYQWNEGCYKDITPPEDQLLWADAISINQEDVEEKNHQVPLMYQIYSQALLAFAWLGPPEPTILEGFHAVTFMASKICSLAPGESSSWIWTKDVDFVALYTALERLLNIPYWRRAWILQELVLSREVLFLCGQETLPLMALVLFQNWRTGCRQVYLDARSSRPDYLDKDLWRQITTIGYDTDPVIGVIMVLKLSLSFRKKLGDSPVDRGVTMMFFDKQIRLQSSLGTCYQATNAKDHVYAFLGILGCYITVDYSPAKSVAGVYRDWIEAMLCCPHFKLPGTLCKLSFLDRAGIGYFRESIPDLPSWVPNFSGRKDETHVAPDLFWGRPELRFKRASSKYIRNGSRLYCPSILFDDITHVSPRIDHGEDYPDAGWAKWSLDSILRCPYEGPTSQHKIFGLAECLVNNSKRFTDLPMPIYCQPGSVEAMLKNHRQLMEQILNQRGFVEGKDKDDLNGPIFDTFRRCEVRPLLSILLRTWKKKYPYHDVGWYPEMLAFKDLSKCVFEEEELLDDSLTRDWPTAIAFASGLCLAETSDGCIGLCPPRVQLGDVVAMLQGCTNPVVLRKIGHHYNIVGVSYFSVYLKETETLNKLLEQGKLKEKIIEIR
jgi:hypothetical protein